MTTATPDAITIRYEGPGTGTEVIAMTQANFLVARTGHAAKELAVLINDAAMAFLAAELGGTNDQPFRDNAARVAGRIWIDRHVPRVGRLEPLLVVSRATFDEDPGFLEAIKAVIGR